MKRGRCQKKQHANEQTHTSEPMNDRRDLQGAQKRETRAKRGKERSSPIQLPNRQKMKKHQADVEVKPEKQHLTCAYTRANQKEKNESQKKIGKNTAQMQKNICPIRKRLRFCNQLRATGTHAQTEKFTPLKKRHRKMPQFMAEKAECHQAHHAPLIEQNEQKNAEKRGRAKLQKKAALKIKSHTNSSPVSEKPNTARASSLTSKDAVTSRLKSSRLVFFVQSAPHANAKTNKKMKKNTRNRPLFDTGSPHFRSIL